MDTKVRKSFKCPKHGLITGQPKSLSINITQNDQSYGHEHYCVLCIQDWLRVNISRLTVSEEK